VSAPGLTATEQLYDLLCTVAAVPLQVTAATPERESETLPDTVAGDEVRVSPFAGDAMDKTGGVRSMFNVTGAVAVNPARSVTVPATCWLAPAVLIVWGAVQVAIGAVPAVHV
jgi:hypothetical protein